MNWMHKIFCLSVMPDEILLNCVLDLQSYCIHSLPGPNPSVLPRRPPVSAPVLLTPQHFINQPPPPLALHQLLQQQHQKLQQLQQHHQLQNTSHHVQNYGQEVGSQLDDHICECLCCSFLFWMLHSLMLCSFIHWYRLLWIICFLGIAQKMEKCPPSECQSKHLCNIQCPGGEGSLQSLLCFRDVVDPAEVRSHCSKILGDLSPIFHTTFMRIQKVNVDLCFFFFFKQQHQGQSQGQGSSNGSAITVTSGLSLSTSGQVASAASSSSSVTQQFIPLQV